MVTGRKYDKEGNRRQWWSDEAIQRFTNKTKCIIDQYNKYVMPLAKINVSVVLIHQFCQTSGTGYVTWHVTKTAKKRYISGEATAAGSLQSPSRVVVRLLT